MKFTLRLHAFLVTCAMLFSSQATAGPTLLVDANGILTGVENVLANGELWDVSFIDGTCPAVFSGCNTPNNFVFKNATAATQAAQALMDQVFINGSRGDFDNKPFLTFGCAEVSACYSLIPYASDSINFQFAYSYNSTVFDDFPASFAWISLPYDTAENPFANYARFSPADGAVPEPSSIFLIGVAMAGLAFSRRHKS